MADNETQIKRMIKEMKKRKVKNYEFSQMFILNHTARMTNIRQMGFSVQRERVYDENGKATGVHQYWIPRVKRPKRDLSHEVDGQYYEITPKSKFFNKAMNKLRRLKV